MNSSASVLLKSYAFSSLLVYSPDTGSQVVEMKLMDGIVSPICLIEKRVSYLRMKTCHVGYRLLGDCSFEHTRQMLKWMD